MDDLQDQERGTEEQECACLECTKVRSDSEAELDSILDALQCPAGHRNRISPAAATQANNVFTETIGYERGIG